MVSDVPAISQTTPTPERKAAKIVLEDGTEFHGFSFGAQTSTTGEIGMNLVEEVGLETGSDVLFIF